MRRGSSPLCAFEILAEIKEVERRKRSRCLAQSVLWPGNLEHWVYTELPVGMLDDRVKLGLACSVTRQLKPASPLPMTYQQVLNPGVTGRNDIRATPRRVSTQVFQLEVAWANLHGSSRSNLNDCCCYLLLRTVCGVFRDSLVDR